MIRPVAGSSRTRVLLAVIALHDAYGYGPSYTDLEHRTGLTRGTLQAHLTHLRRSGLVAWEDGKARTLRPLVAVVA